MPISDVYDRQRYTGMDRRSDHGNKIADNSQHSHKQEGAVLSSPGIRTNLDAAAADFVLPGVRKVCSVKKPAPCQLNSHNSEASLKDLWINNSPTFLGLYKPCSFKMQEECDKVTQGQKTKSGSSNRFSDRRHCVGSQTGSVKVEQSRQQTMNYSVKQSPTTSERKDVSENLKSTPKKSTTSPIGAGGGCLKKKPDTASKTFLKQDSGSSMSQPIKVTEDRIKVSSREGGARRSVIKSCPNKLLYNSSGQSKEGTRSQSSGPSLGVKRSTQPQKQYQSSQRKISPWLDPKKLTECSNPTSEQIPGHHARDHSTGPSIASKASAVQDQHNQAGEKLASNSGKHNASSPCQFLNPTEVREHLDEGEIEDCMRKDQNETEEYTTKNPVVRSRMLPLPDPRHIFNDTDYLDDRPGHAVISNALVAPENYRSHSPDQVGRKCYDHSAEKVEDSAVRSTDHNCNENKVLLPPDSAGSSLHQDPLSWQELHTTNVCSNWDHGITKTPVKKLSGKKPHVHVPPLSNSHDEGCANDQSPVDGHSQEDSLEHVEPAHSSSKPHLDKVLLGNVVVPTSEAFTPSYISCDQDLLQMLHYDHTDPMQSTKISGTGSGMKSLYKEIDDPYGFQFIDTAEVHPQCPVPPVRGSSVMIQERLALARGDVTSHGPADHCDVSFGSFSSEDLKETLLNSREMCKETGRSWTGCGQMVEPNSGSFSSGVIIPSLHGRQHGKVREPQVQPKAKLNGESPHHHIKETQGERKGPTTRPDAVVMDTKFPGSFPGLHTISGCSFFAENYTDSIKASVPSSTCSSQVKNGLPAHSQGQINNGQQKDAAKVSLPTYFSGLSQTGVLYMML